MRIIRENNWTIVYIIVYLFIVILGLFLIAISLQIQITGFWSFLPEFIKELGIVVLAVFVISLFYEKSIAKRHFEHFRRQLEEKIELGESNLSVCAHLGINEIYKTREDLIRKYPLKEIMVNLSKTSELRIVAISLFHFMSQPDLVKEALKNGARIELCIFDPNSNQIEINKIFQLVASDLLSTISIFKENIINWIKTECPRGNIELRYHQIVLFDTILYVKSKSECYAVWDFNFGRDMTHKRGFLLDPTKPLGKDLLKRFDRIYENGELIFKYCDKTITENKLNEVLSLK